MPGISGLPQKLLGVLLTATHIKTGESLSFELTEGEVLLGRATAEDPIEKLGVPFDPRLSRRTAKLNVQSQVVEVQRDGSRYPIFFGGKEVDDFKLSPGQRFSSAETVFELHPGASRTLTVQVVKQIGEENPKEILRVLLGIQDLLSRWSTLPELAADCAKLLRELLPNADSAMLEVNQDHQPSPLHTTTLLPSRSLLAEALKEGLPAYHVWSGSTGDGQPTQYGGENWALACPLPYTQRSLVLYSVGRETSATPGEILRGSIALVARILGQHLESRHSAILAARVEMETRVNRKLEHLLDTIERVLELDQESGYQRFFLDCAKELTGADQAYFELDLSELVGEERHSALGHDKDGPFLAMPFEKSWPEGVVCRRPQSGQFTPDDATWLGALAGFADTVFENRRLHNQVKNSFATLQNRQDQLIRSSQWAAAGRLAANAAHELNTPLGAIKLAAETARSFLVEPPRAATDGLELILRSVERCKKVTQRFLVYSKPRRAASPSNFRLKSVATDAVDSVQTLLDSKQIDLEIDIPEETAVLGDAQDCFWALANLLRNAAEATSQSDSRTIRLSCSEFDKTIEMRVDDSGIGIPAELQVRLFEPFFSTKKVGEANGLGLAISRRNLREWGGELVLSKSELGGACFCLILPAHSR